MTAATSAPLATPIDIEPFQLRGWQALCGPATDVLLFGGAGSGKTQLVMLWMVLRALAKPTATHVILRHHFAHIKASIVYDTLPDVCARHWPGQQIYKLNKSDWYADFGGGGRIYFGGLDDKERTEKILGQGHCVDPASRILTADLRWVRADSVRVGQELVGFPENLTGHQVLRRSVVESAGLVEEDRFRVVTDQGETIVSAGHGFVSYHDDRRTKNARMLSWRLASDLRPGDIIRFAAKPWDAGRSWESGWLAGMLDGEGWCSEAAQQCGVAQNEGPTLDRLVEAFDAHDVRCNVYHAATSSGWGSKNWHVIVRGKWPALRLLGIVRPPRLLPKSAGLWEGVRGFNSMTGEHHAKVLRVEPLGLGPVVALSTSTKTFIADGFLGHNSTAYLNETSQISYASYLKASTRVRQNRGLKLKVICDENPPMSGHWTERLWVKGVDPTSGKPLANPGAYAYAQMNPCDNPHLPAAYKARLQALPPRERARFWEGKFGDGTESPLWTYDSVEAARVAEAPELGEIIVSVDPSGCHGPEEKRSDEIGIVVVGLASGVVYVLEDASGRYGPSGPEGWGAKVVQLFVKHGADRVVAETNFGGAMVGAVIHAAQFKDRRGTVHEGGNVPFRELTASRGKHVRAEPVATLCDRGRVRFAGTFPELEEQLRGFSTAGYVGERSPDRADAFVWAVHALGIVPDSAAAAVQWAKDQIARQGEVARAVIPSAGPLVELVVPPGFAGSSGFSSIEGTQYAIEAGRIRAKPGEVDGLRLLGFVPA